MKTIASRRRAAGLALIAVGLALLPTLSAAQPDPRILQSNPMFPAKYDKVVGFFKGETEWYESVHTKDFLAFAAPYMARYARNWIVGVEAGEGPTDFNVITEIRYKDAAAKAEVQRLMFTAPGLPLLTHSADYDRAHREQTAKPAGPKVVPLYSVEPRISKSLGGAATLVSPAERRLVLLRRPDGAEQSAFEQACADLARQIERQNRNAVVSLDVFGSNPHAGPADAIIYVAGTGSAPLPLHPHRAAVVRSVYRVQTRSSID